MALSSDSNIVREVGSNEYGGVSAARAFTPSSSGSDYQDPPMSSTSSNPTLNFEE
jgi:hypothetical protein